MLRSAALRSLHDIIVAYGLGANLISPYFMFLSLPTDDTKPSVNLFNALNKGLEKVISTIGIHELRGYGRLFSSIGLNDEIANYLNIVNFFGSNEVEQNFETLKEDAIKRAVDYQNETERIGKTFHIFPRIWKSIGEMAATGSYEAYREKISEQEEIESNNDSPFNIVQSMLTHLFLAKMSIFQLTNMTILLSFLRCHLVHKMKLAFRAYAEAANRLNMISLNGEGGEIKDMLGKYPNITRSANCFWSLRCQCRAT